MKVIIIGATGATGKSLVDQLLKDNSYTEVVTLVRRTSGKTHPKLKEHLVDFDHLIDYQHLIVGDVAFSCLGTTIKDAGTQTNQRKVDYDYQYQFAQLAAQKLIPTFVLVSSMNANANSKIFYSRLKGELEDAIIKLPFQHIHIFRPGFLNRPHSDRNGEIIGLKVLSFFNSLGLFKKYKPLKVENLAKALILSIQLNKNKISIYEMKDIHDILSSKEAY